MDGANANLTSGAPYDAELPLPSRDAKRMVPVRELDGRCGLLDLMEGIPVTVGGLVPIQGQFYLDSDSTEKMLTNVDLKTDKVALIRESDARPPEAFLFDPISHSLLQLTHVNDNLGRSPVVHKVTWVAPSGPHFGFLYEPVGVSTELRPVIVQVYPNEPSHMSLSGMSFPLHQGMFLPPVAALLAQGYAVFKPDLSVVGNGRTCDDLSSNLDLALESVGRNHWGDTKRAVLVGASFGGWTVNCVITRTNRFKGAISIAGPSDQISASFSANSHTRDWEVGGGQTDIDQSIWQAPLLYWKESPISGAPDVKTPLLLIHGTADAAVPVSQSFEMFSALSDLGKDVTLVTYGGADHGSVLSHPDLIPRVIRWVQDRVGAL
jgi:dipeptidyl aminopeptidase/acylaminoacyl peptidase